MATLREKIGRVIREGQGDGDSARTMAMNVIVMMEDNGVNLYGLGWIDDDSEALAKLGYPAE